MKFHCRHCEAEVQADWQYCLTCGKKLPMKTNQKRVADVAQREINWRQDWLWYQQNPDGFRGVEMQARKDACPVCRSYAGKFYDLGTPPPLPHIGCQCEWGCACRFNPVRRTHEEIADSAIRRWREREGYR